jgi:adenosylcobinamide kinase / adenosylcobinamide-phosphate guanylyltransferase
MGSNRVILVGGGTRSGKSDFALDLARSLGRRRLFVATAQAGDEEMIARINLHRATRGPDFTTLEEPRAIAAAIRRAADYDVVVVDCLTIWISNLLLADESAKAVHNHLDELAACLAAPPAHVVLVTSEVGLGLVPETALGRTFRDLAGLAHQRLACLSQEVYFGVLGVMLRLKPGPVFCS